MRTRADACIEHAGMDKGRSPLSYTLHQFNNPTFVGFLNCSRSKKFDFWARWIIATCADSSRDVLLGHRDRPRRSGRLALPWYYRRPGWDQQVRNDLMGSFYPFVWRWHSYSVPKYCRAPARYAPRLILFISLLYVLRAIFYLRAWIILLIFECFFLESFLGCNAHQNIEAGSNNTNAYQHIKYRK